MFFKKDTITEDQLADIIAAAVAKELEKKTKDEASLYKYIFSEQLEKIASDLKYYANSIDRLEKSIKNISFEAQRLSIENRKLREECTAKDKVIGRKNKQIKKLKRNTNDQSLQDR